MIDPIEYQRELSKRKQAQNAIKTEVLRFLTNKMNPRERISFLNNLENLEVSEQVVWLLRIQLELHKLKIPSACIIDYDRIQKIVAKHCE